ncbi:alpha/beta hydrolase [Paraburkholderia strydomiana]
MAVIRGITPLDVTDLRIQGHAQAIPLRLYRRAAATEGLPVILYFHGGGFVRGSLAEADYAARYLANHTPALVVSVGYSLAPSYPFPAALEDAWHATVWTQQFAHRYGGNSKKIGVAGYDAGGSLANGLALIARDRGGIPIDAQALFGPMLDPSLTLLGDEQRLASDITATDCADSYRAYLPQSSQRLHPYAAPLESKRLTGLPATHIATAENDVLHVEAETYASRLIAAGVRTQVIRYASVSHAELGNHALALLEVVHFFQWHFGERPCV